MSAERDAKLTRRARRKHATTGIPFVTLKAAVTLDGRIATRDGDSKWITGEPARREAHRMRNQNDAVLVGIGTVLADDPELTVRMVRGADPLRAVLDADLRTPHAARIVEHGSKRPTLIFHAPDVPAERASALTRKGVELVPVARAEGGLDLRAVLVELGRRGVVRLLVEGGGRVHGAMLDAGLVDRAAIFVAPAILGDAQAHPLADGHGAQTIAAAWRLGGCSVRKLGEDVLFEGDVRRGEKT